MTNARRWRYFALVFACGAAMAMTLMAVPPAMPLLMEFYGMGAGTASWFMAIASLASMVVALFAGVIQNRLNPRGLLILGMALASASAAVCMLSSTGPLLMLVGRLVFGAGMGCVNAAGPTLVMVLWDDPSKRAVPMAVWACYIAVGSTIMLNSFTAISPLLGGWAAGFALGGICCLCALALFVFVARIPRASLERVSGGGGSAFASMWRTVRRIEVLALFVMMMCFSFVWSAWTTMAPTYMQTGGGMDGGLANSMTSISTLTAIVGSLIAGFAMGRIKNQPLLALVFMLAMAVFGALEFVFVDAAAIAAESALVGLACNAAMPAFMLCVQWAIRDVSEMGAAMAFTSSFGVGVGGVVALPLVGGIYDATASWAAATVPVAVAGVVGVLFAILFVKRCGKRSVEALGQQK